MHLQELQLSNFRNFTQAKIKPAKGVNLLVGANASGKTSILEAIYFFSLARSFRSKKLNNLIQHEQEGFTVFALLGQTAANSYSLGMQRQTKEAETSILLNGQKPTGIAELTSLLPMQLINPEAFRLLEGSPSERRHFIDWGVFHVEPSFVFTWRRFQQALKQRNSLLRRGRIEVLQLQVWEEEVAKQGELITLSRQTYLQELKPIFNRLLTDFLPSLQVELSFLRGWDKNLNLLDSLSQARNKDMEQGFTQTGPQRADMRLTVNGYPAMEVLSRGQLKLTVSALKLAQGELLRLKNNKRCIYLVDDLPAELDRQHRKVFCSILEQQASQVFITGVDAQALSDGWQQPENIAWFHVEHGEVSFQPSLGA